MKQKTLTPFQQELASDKGTFTFNGKPMPFAIYNLIVSKRDLSLWTKIKMKPHRNWKVSDLKNYFGITGEGQKLMDNFMLIFDHYLPKN